MDLVWRLVRLLLVVLVSSAIVPGNPLAGQEEQEVEMVGGSTPVATPVPTSVLAEGYHDSSSTTVNPTPTPTADCSEPVCRFRWDGENWTSNTVSEYYKGWIAVSRTEIKLVRKLVCASGGIFTFGPPVCKYKKESVSKTVLVNECNRTRKTKRNSLDLPTSISLDREETQVEKVWQVEARKKHKIFLEISEYNITCGNDGSQGLYIWESPCKDPVKLCNYGNNTTFISESGKFQIKYKGHCNDNGGSYFRGQLLELSSAQSQPVGSC